VSAAGVVKLAIKPKGKAKSKLNKTGKAKVKVKVTYTPSATAGDVAGDPNTHTSASSWSRRSRPAVSKLLRRLIALTSAALVVAALDRGSRERVSVPGQVGRDRIGNGQLSGPFDLAVVPTTGSQYVADEGNNASSSSMPAVAS